MPDRLQPAVLPDRAERLAALSADLLGTVDAEGRLVWVNPAWEALLGLTETELLGARYLDLVHPDDRTRAAAFAGRLEHGEGGARPQIELRVRTSGGDHRWLQFGAAPDPEDGVVHLSGRDVTERRAAETGLRASEQRHAAVTRSTSDAIVSADAAGRIIFFNLAAERIFGYGEHEALGRDLTVLMPERHRAAHQEGLRRYLETGASRVIGTTLALEGLRRDGSEFPIELSIGAWEEGEATCFTALVRDVSDRVEAHRALRQAEKRFAAAFEGAAVGLALLTPDGELLRSNRALAELTGYSHPDLLEHDLASLTHPEDRGTDAEAIAAMLAGRTRRLATERRFVRADGEVIHVRINLSLIRDLEDRPLHFVAQIEDVTERRRMLEALTLSEARYKGLVGNLPDSVITLFDHDLRLLIVEGGQLSHLGIRAADVEGRLLKEYLPQESFERAAEHYRAALAGEHRDFETTSLRDQRVYRVQVVPLRDETGAVMGGMAVARDVTERRRAERTLAERNRDLERSNAELEQFAYVASHDLSEPLRMVSSYLALLRRRYHGQLDEDADTFIGFAVDGAARMQALIDDLLAYSRAGRSERPPEAIDTEALVGEVVDMLHVCDAVQLGPLPPVQGDAYALGQLFQNLIGNAVKFVPADRQPRIEVSAEPEPDVPAWRFTVADNGIGIDPRHADRIFRMFQRLHGRDEFPGTGIGLAISRKVVERHGGEIWAEPRSEGGTRFCFTLPEAEAIA
jgi:PAS domain S-box-containing protein